MNERVFHPYRYLVRLHLQAFTINPSRVDPRRTEN